MKSNVTQHDVNGISADGLRRRLHETVERKFKTMKQLFFLVILLLFSSYLYGQKQIRSYVEKNIHSIKSIQPHDTDYTDLQQLGDAIGNARIVMIGEQEHGDGATFLAKTRLVKYLHEKKGFNVLAFESDFFGMNEGWDKIPKVEDSIKIFLRRNILPAWSACGQCDELLYSYVPKTYQTQTPLIMSGFDSQFSLNYSNYNINKFIDSYLAQNNIPYISSPNYKTHFLPFIPYARFSYPGKTPAHLKNFEIAIDSILNQLEEKGKNDFGLLVLENLKESAKKIKVTTKDGVSKTNIRDAQMAENLNWLAKTKFPNQKIIVWAANAHIMKHTPDAYKEKAKPYKWMGTVFTENSSNMEETYVLGFNSKRGKSKWASDKETKSVNSPLKNGFENWIDDHYKYAFIDFKAFRKENPNYSEYFVMKAQGHNNITAVYTNVFDGIFYIREMEPCIESTYNHSAR